MSRSHRISPTADYTSYIWYRAGLSEEIFTTRRGYVLYKLLKPMNDGAKLIGRPSLKDMLLARHRGIDCVLSQAIETGKVGQVLEVAAGLSPRGRDFSARFADRNLVYVEGDLPQMANKKRAILRRARPQPGDHRVVSLDALSDYDLSSTCSGNFDPSRGTAIVTEGLLPYIETASVFSMWRCILKALSRFPFGLYLSDLHVETEMRGLRGSRTFAWILSAFTRGRVYTHFYDVTEAKSKLQDLGFSRATLHDAADLVKGSQSELGMVRVIEAWC